jgi:glycosyltransferase involved in cell wall biosynthesis
VPELLASFDVFAFPSLFEGLCLAVIEAQAAGVPVVATPVGGIRETVVDGETGLLVPPRDPAALAVAIRRLLDDPDLARRLADEARRRVRETYSEQRMIELTLGLYGTM